MRYFFEGRDDDPRYFDGKLNPFLLIFMLFAFYHYRFPDRVRTEQWFLLAFGTLFFFFSFFLEALRIRYIVPAVPMFAILATFGLHNIHARLSNTGSVTRKSASLIIAILAIAPLAYNGHYLWEQFTYYKPIEYLSGRISRDDYLARYLPDYPVQRYAAEHIASRQPYPGGLCG